MALVGMAPRLPRSQTRATVRRCRHRTARVDRTAATNISVSRRRSSARSERPAGVTSGILRTKSLVPRFGESVSSGLVYDFGVGGAVLLEQDWSLRLNRGGQLLDRPEARRAEKGGRMTRARLAPSRQHVLISRCLSPGNVAERQSLQLLGENNVGANIAVRTGGALCRPMSRSNTNVAAKMGRERPRSRPHD